MAGQIATDISRWGGFVTLEDLNTYRPKWEAPLIGSYRGYKVVTAPLPACGVTLLEMLQVAERYPLATLEHSSAEHLDLMARIMRWGLRDRALYLGDPAYVPVAVDDILSDGRAARAQEMIDRRQDIVVPRWKPAETGTTQVCAADQHGNLVSLTHSLGAASGVVTTDLGFQYNNAMNCFDPLPGKPNSIAPGKSRVSGITPTILDDGRGSKIVIGAPGGARITNSVFQVIINIVDFGMSATEAVSAPRMDCQGEVIDVEARVPNRVCEDLGRRGNKVARSVASYWDYPLVHVIVLNPSGKGLDGAADPRGEGSALRE